MTLTLREMEGLPYEEIAKVDGVSNGYGHVAAFLRAAAHAEEAERAAMKCRKARKWISLDMDGELPVGKKEHALQSRPSVRRRAMPYGIGG